MINFVNLLLTKAKAKQFIKSFAGDLQRSHFEV